MIWNNLPVDIKKQIHKLVFDSYDRFYATKDKMVVSEFLRDDKNKNWMPVYENDLITSYKQGFLICPQNNCMGTVKIK